MQRKAVGLWEEFGNQQRRKQCCSKCEIGDRQKKVKFHFTYLGATNKVN